MSALAPHLPAPLPPTVSVSPSLGPAAAEGATCFPLPPGRSPGAGTRVGGRRWRSLREEVLGHVRSRRDLQGVELTIERLADELDEALGLVERRVEELRWLGLVSVSAEGRIEPIVSPLPMVG